MRTLAKAAIIRAIRTFFQTILGMWTAGMIITQVDWKTVLLASASAAVYSLLTSIVAGLPEVENGYPIEEDSEGVDDYEKDIEEGDAE